MARDGAHTKKRFPFLRETRSEPHSSSDPRALPPGQSRRGWVASLRSKAKDLFDRNAGHNLSPNRPQQNSVSIDARQDPALVTVPEEGTDKLANLTFGHASVSLKDPSPSDGNHNASTSGSPSQRPSGKLPETDNSMRPDEGRIPSGAESNDSTTHEISNPDSEGVDAVRLHAREAVSGLKPVFGPVQAVVLDVNGAGDPVATADNITPLLGTLSKFNSLVGTIAEIHPYTKAAWGILSVVLKTITSQTTRDDSIIQLLSKMDEVYMFLTQNDLVAIASMKSVVARICQQTLECSYFLRDYSKSKNFWIRLGRNVISETDDTVKRFNAVFDDLMQQFRDRAVRDTAVAVHRMLEGVQELIEGADLSGMVYARGAGLDTRKKCLPGTREEILGEITTWINNDEDDAPRVFWLHGNAGTGKSSIAHTIADRFRQLGRLGSCYCFDRTQAAQRRHEKVFTTIARDLADRDEQMRRALADSVHHNTSLTNTPDITQQWKEMILKPASKLSDAMVGPTLIVIEALDESGDDNTRQHLLRILAGKLDDESRITKLPPNFRILLTSRPLADIHSALNGVEYVRHKSMDGIPSTSTERDILRYVTNELLDVEGVQGDELLTSLARESGGLFEWARLACAYIKRENDAGLTAPERFEAILSHHSSDSDDHVPLLDQMYKFTLKTIFPQNQPQRKARLTRFRSVMAQVLGTLEPLPLASLRSMKRHFPEEGNPDVLTAIIKPLGALLSGTTDPSAVVRPLHASFPDFLTDKKRSGEFFVDTCRIDNDLAFATLGVMEDRLRFNICRLPSSYLANSDISDLDERIKQHISPELSYSCRFWTNHLRNAPFNMRLADGVRAFFNHERFLFWFEVLSLLKMISTSAGSLLSVIQWVKHVDFKDISDDAADARRFIRMFGFPISFSTPHLYLSALPFSPKASRIRTKFANAFPSVLQVVSGHYMTWPAIQHALHIDTLVMCAAFSPDGKRIVSGSYGGLIQLWDAETGESLRPPLTGHTNYVSSVAFSPDGKRIVSGSYDKTIRLWDVETGEPLRPPLTEHEHCVFSVAFSPDGKRIASGSWDKTIRLWNAETGEPLGPPLRGHERGINCVAFSPDGKCVVSGGSDGTIRLWDAETLEMPRLIMAHKWEVYSVAFSPDGKRIASGSNDMTIRLWDTETGMPLQPALEGHEFAVRSVAFSPDGKRIVSGSEDKTIRLWDAETGMLLEPPLQGHEQQVMSVSFSPDGKRVMSGSWDRTILLWDVETAQGLRPPLKGHHDYVTSVAFSLDSKRIVSGSYDDTIWLWDVETGELLWSHIVAGTGDVVRSVAFSPDGKRIVSASDDGSIRLWDAQTGEQLNRPRIGHAVGATSVAFSPDSKYIVSGSWDKTIRLWNAETSEPLSRPLMKHEAGVTSVAFSSDGKGIVSGSRDKTIRVWDVETGELLSPPLQGHEADVICVAFSPDNKRVVSGSDDHTIRLWDVETGIPLLPILKGHEDVVQSVAFSPDGKRVVSGSYDETIRLWDAGTGELLGLPLYGHKSSVNCVAFSQDNKCIVSASDDKTIRLWDVETTLFEGHASSVGSIPDIGIDTTSRPRDPAISPNIRTHDLQHFIRFSMDPAHALVDTAALLDEITAPTQALPVRIRADDRWAVIGPKDRLLFWVPSTYNLWWYPPRMRWAIPLDPRVDLSHMAHGLSWDSCYGT